MADVAMNNPAGRLHALFQSYLTVADPDHPAVAEGRVRTSTGLELPPPRRIDEVLGEVWSLGEPRSWQSITQPVKYAVLPIYDSSTASTPPPAPPPEGPVTSVLTALLRRMTVVVELPAQVEAAVKALPQDNPLAKAEVELTESGSWHRAVHAMLNFSGAPDTVSEHITGASQAGLKRCSVWLSGTAPEPIVPRADLQRLRNSVRIFIDDVLSADIDKELRDFLLHQLRTVQDALAEVDLRGIEAVAASLELIVGKGAIRGRAPVERLSRERPDFAKRLKMVGAGLAFVALPVTEQSVSTFANLQELLSRPSAYIAPAQLEAPVAPPPQWTRCPTQRDL